MSWELGRMFGPLHKPYGVLHLQGLCDRERYAGLTPFELRRVVGSATDESVVVLSAESDRGYVMWLQ